jgi:hypothetical protein
MREVTKYFDVNGKQTDAAHAVRAHRLVIDDEGRVVREENFNVQSTSPIKPVTHGGPGSGNFGHEGRPGQVGGSGGGGGTSVSTKEGYAAAKTAFEDKLTEKQRQAVDDYTGMSYGINEALERTKGTIGTIQSREDRATIRLLDEAFESAPTLKEDIILYRGVQKTPSTGFTAHQYLSTTADKKVAEALFAGEGGTVVEVHVPKGTRFIPTGGEGREILLPRDRKIEVDGSKWTVAGRASEFSTNAERQVFRFQTTSQKKQLGASFGKA